MTEFELEKHICNNLTTLGWQQQGSIDAVTYIDKSQLLAYLKTSEAWQSYEAKQAPGAALEQLLLALTKHTGSTLSLLQKGIILEPDGVHIDLLSVADWTKNKFSFVRQVQHSANNKALKGDVCLWVNGLPLGFVEVKNEQTGQSAKNAVSQIVDRYKRNEAPRLFELCIFNLAVDTNTAYLSIDPSSTKHFRPFTPSKETYQVPTNDFYTAYLYGGETAFLHPKNLTELLGLFLYVDPKKKQVIFPRYHQWEAARLLKSLCLTAYQRHHLGERFLFQHSTGSGKSKTIAWGARFLATLKLPKSQQSLFQKILIVTDRKNLDGQIQRDLEPVLGEKQVVRAETTKHLAELLSLNCSTPVITSTVQKFLDLGQLQFSKDDRVCIIIDEAHRSQDGNYNEQMQKTVVANFDGFEKSGYDITEASLFALDKLTAEQSNAITVAFTATPSKQTLQRFGKAGKPHHLYSMRQAIDEGYILNPLKNVITYDTIYQLHQKGMWHLTGKEYPAALLSKNLTQAAYENPEIIEAKSNIMSAIVLERTRHAIGGKGKAMLVCSSKRAAVLFQKALKDKLVDYDIKPLIAYTGTQADATGVELTEGQVNAKLGATQSIEKTFEQELAYRILVVVNKFQTGFDEPLLHTLFVDKPLQGINAVQTLSRINRAMDGKEDTLVVDFTNSYQEIAKAFQQYIDLPPTFEQRVVSEADLVTKFTTVLELTGTADVDWDLELNPAAPEGKIALDKKCKELSDKIKATCAGDVNTALNALLTDLLYLASKGLLTRFKVWEFRKLVVKGVLGYLKSESVHFSVEEIRESVATVGMAVSLERIAEGEVIVKQITDKEGGKGKSLNLSLASAIHSINLKNFSKLSGHLAAIAEQKEQLLEKEPDSVKPQLVEFCEQNQEALDAYAGFDATDPEAAADYLLREKAKSLRESLETEESPSELIKKWLVLAIKETRFRTLEAAFNAANTNLLTANEAAMMEATRIEKKL